MGVNASRPAVYDGPAYGLLITFFALTTLSTVARAGSRYLQKAAFGADDAMAYLAYFFNLGNIFSTVAAVSQGSSNLPKLANATPEQLWAIKHCFTATSVFYNLTIISVKLSMLLLLRRIFTLRETWFSVFWWINFAFIFPCWSVTAFTMVIYTNVKVIFVGDKTMAYAILAVSAATALSDIMLLILPVRCVSQLNLALGHRIAIAGLFCLGLITTLVSLARVSVTAYKTDHTVDWNPAYSTYVDTIFAAAEVTASVMCVCLPVTKPFFTRAGELAVRGAYGATSLLSLVPRTMSRSASRPGSGNDGSYVFPQNGYSKRNVNRVRTVEVDSVPLKSYASSTKSLERELRES